MNSSFVIASTGKNTNRQLHHPPPLPHKSIPTVLKQQQTVIMKVQGRDEIKKKQTVKIRETPQLKDSNQSIEFSKNKDKGYYSQERPNKAVDLLKPKEDETLYMKKLSDSYFFEIFNKLEKKCQLRIPDTVFVSGNAIMHWYFTSKSDGVVLRKKQSKLNATDLFISLCKQSPLLQEFYNQDKFKAQFFLRDEDFGTVPYYATQVIIQGEVDGASHALENNRQLKVESQSSHQKQSGNLITSNNQRSIANKEQTTSLALNLTRKNDAARESMLNKRDINISAYDSYRPNENQISKSAQAKHPSLETQQTNKSFLSLFLSDILKRPPGAYKKNISEDVNLPYIAFVQFHEKGSRPVKPYELYCILHDHLTDIRMVQTYVFSKGSQEFKTELNDEEKQQVYKMDGTLTSFQAVQIHNQIVKKAQKLTKGGCYILQYTHYCQQQPPKFEVFKNRLSKKLELKINQQAIKCLNHIINEKIQTQAKVLISYIESTVGIDVKRMQMKFIEDLQGNIVYLGARDEIVFVRRGADQIISSTRVCLLILQLTQTNDDMGREEIKDYYNSYHKKNHGQQDDFNGFASTKIIPDLLPEWKSSKVQRICFGHFCKFHINKNNERYLMILKSKRRQDQKQHLIPSKNKVLQDQIEYTIGALLIKKVTDNLDITKYILKSNSIAGDYSLLNLVILRKLNDGKIQIVNSATRARSLSYNANPNESPQKHSMHITPIKPDKALGGKQSASMVSTSTSPVQDADDMNLRKCKQKYVNKIIYPDNYGTLYKAVSVCQKCFVIYSILSEYFDSDDQAKLSLVIQEINKEKEKLAKQSPQQNKLPSSIVSPQKTQSHLGSPAKNKQLNKILTNNSKSRAKAIASIIEQESLSSIGSPMISGRRVKLQNYESLQNNKTTNDKRILAKKHVTMNLGSLDHSKESLRTQDSFKLSKSQLQQVIKLNQRMSVPMFKRGTFGLKLMNQTTFKNSDFLKLNSTLLKMETAKSMIQEKEDSELETLNQICRPTEIQKIRQLPEISYKIDVNKIAQKNMISLKQKTEAKLVQSPMKLDQKLNHTLIQLIKPPLASLLTKHIKRDSIQSIKKLKKEILISKSSGKFNAMKQTMGISLKLKQEGDLIVPPQDMRRRRQLLNIVNFYYEISKDVKKYQIRRKLTEKVGGHPSGDKISHIMTPKLDKLLKFKSRKQNIQSYDDFQSDKRSDRDDSSEMMPDYSLILNQRIKDIRDQKYPQSASNESTYIFKNKLQEAIVKLAQSYIVKYQASKVTFEKNMSQDPNHHQKVRFNADKEVQKADPIIQSNIARKMTHTPLDKNRINQQKFNLIDTDTHQSYNITSSFFHHTKTKHTMKTPFYRVTTPKVPIYNFDKAEEDNHDDKFIIPLETYSTIRTDLYCEMMKIVKSNLGGACVFFVDECTSIVYEILRSTSNYIMEESDAEASHTYIILLDIFDDFTTKRQFFENLVGKVSRPIRFLLLNFPGSRFTQFNIFKTHLNNKFFCSCLDLLFFHLHQKGDLDFLTDKFSFIGFGNGANIAISYACQIGRLENLSSILSFNGYINVEGQFKSTIQNLIKNFNSTPVIGKLQSQYSDFYYYNLIYSADKVLNNQQEILEQTEKQERAVTIYEASSPMRSKNQSALSHSAQKVQINTSIAQVSQQQMIPRIPKKAESQILIQDFETKMNRSVQLFPPVQNYKHVVTQSLDRGILKKNKNCHENVNLKDKKSAQSSSRNRTILPRSSLNLLSASQSLSQTQVVFHQSQGPEATTKLLGYQNNLKISVLKGVLGNIAVVDKVSSLNVPIICIYSERNCFVELNQQEQIINAFDRFKQIKKEKIVRSQATSFRLDLSHPRNDSSMIIDPYLSNSQREASQTEQTAGQYDSNEFREGTSNEEDGTRTRDLYQMHHRYQTNGNDRQGRANSKKQNFLQYAKIRQSDDRNVIHQLLKDKVKRVCLMIDGGHDVFVENKLDLESILFEYITYNQD